MNIIRKRILSLTIAAITVGAAGAALAADSPKFGRDSTYATGRTVGAASQGERIQQAGRGSVYATQLRAAPSVAKRDRTPTVAGNGRGSVYATPATQG